MVFLFSLPVLGQESEPVVVATSAPNYLESFLSTDDVRVSSEPTFDSFLKKLEKKRTSIKKEKDFIEYVFSKTHQTYLKKFEPYASFNSLFSNGSYNCLTGTILYAVILHHFDIPYQVIETNYHIFITVDSKQGKILLEATDPLSGFVDTENGIEKRISTYRQNSLTASNARATYYQFNFDLYRSVSLEELRGLLYYNKAVDSFNHQKLEESVSYLVQAHELYSSSRMEELSMILSIAIQQSNWTGDMKEKSLKLMHPISRKGSPPIASLNSY